MPIRSGGLEIDMRLGWSDGDADEEMWKRSV